MDYAGYIASIAMGITLGIMGGGGSILTVPILVYLFGLSPLAATGYSLFVVGTTSLMGSAMYIRKGEIDLKAGFAFAVPSVIGVNFSRGFVLPQIPATVVQLGSLTLTKDTLVMVIFAILMVAASYSMIKKRKIQSRSAIQPLQRIMFIALLGLIVGIIAGFVGAGGGFLIIPALVFMAGLTMRIAVGTSLLVIAFQSLLGFAGDISRGLVPNWLLLGSVAACAVIGILLGSAFAHKIKEDQLKTAFGWFVLAMGISILLEQLSQLTS